MILGLDVSTSVTGVTVLSSTGDMIYNKSWDTKNKNKFPTLYHKARFIKTKLIQEIKDSFSIEKVFIEKPFMFFNSGGSTAKTMSVLQNFNGMVSWLCCDIFDTHPEHVTAREARKNVGLSIKRGQDSKKVSLQFVVDTVPDFVVEYTRNGNIRSETFDRSDSYIVAKAGSIIESRQS